MFADIQKRLDQIKQEIQDIVSGEDVAKALVEFYPARGSQPLYRASNPR